MKKQVYFHLVEIPENTLMLEKLLFIDYKSRWYY